MSDRETMIEGIKAAGAFLQQYADQFVDNVPEPADMSLHITITTEGKIGIEVKQVHLLWVADNYLRRAKE